MRDVFLLRPLTFVKGLESCGDLSWNGLLGELDDLFDGVLVSCELVRVVPDVTDLPVSPSSVVTVMCEVTTLLLWLGFCGTTVLFLSPRSVHIVAQIRTKR